VNPKHVNLLCNLGVVYASRGEYRDAAGAFHRAIELQPTDPDLHRKLARVYDAMGNSTLAVKHLRVAVRRGPGQRDPPVADPRDARAYRDLAIRSVAQRETEGWHAHALYDGYRALSGQRYELPNSDLTQNILNKTKTVT